MIEEDTAPVVRRRPKAGYLAFGDVVAALNAGVTDFLKAPLFGLFFGGVFMLGGLLAVALFSWFGASWLIVPIGIGFLMIGPLAATGLYEISRRLERKEKLTWIGVLGFVFRRREGQIGWMAFVVLVIFLVWLYQIRLLIALIPGFRPPASLAEFLHLMTTTPEGPMCLSIGIAVGVLLLLVLFALTVIAMPLLIDTDRDVVSAIIISIKTVMANPEVMLVWGLIVTVLTLVALIPAFVGLPVIFPVLGHATWHLYRRVIRRV